MFTDLLRLPQRTVSTLSVGGGAAGAQCFKPHPGLPQGRSQVFCQVVRTEHSIFRSYGDSMGMSKHYLATILFKIKDLISYVTNNSILVSTYPL